MLELNLQEIVKATKGALLKEADVKEIKAVSTDTRKIEEGTMFIALKGENFNGNNYVLDAFNKGAKIAIVDEVKCDLNELKEDVALIKVQNTGRALMDLAKFYREKLGLKVVGITGSAGKTSTKDLVAAVLSDKYKVFKTKGNFNNEIGLPLMILELDSTYDVAILEMGMRGLGQIKELAEIASPDLGIITNIGISHIEILKTRENILKAKMEIATFFDKNNTLVVCGNDDFLGALPEAEYKIVKTGVGENFKIGAKNIALEELSSKFTVYDGEKEEEFSLDMPGEHNISNLMLGIAIAKELGVSFEEMKRGLKNIEATSMRLELIKKDGFSILNDCYNSSPVAVKSAIDVMKNIEGKRRIAVLGTMRELGHKSEEAHEEIGKYAKENGIEKVLCFGNFSENIKEGYGEGCTVYENKEELIKDLLNIICDGDIILVKASRSLKFEEITKALLEK
ncbi:MAG: UDP-N-acetylmuramoyl-tripeptide--D-alanyl-D-alanine ligase [Clostridium perfringens]|uniref:UDP-N-acetylmuramoyl-tripeptide--D-alanyl-D-alanine ligase n=1 Tax=Clostridium perfringens (strain 13 / Type A) TaxID=195102 RepID=Q8XJA0_CLOPE|nr:UDP-N-acetylmuramoyl-tripeptide--D-alanyl-D-alanine ligase [Clostridium perfringens]EHR1326956.1 UDP-N-acetylmuramoyl-tripeptide--D-alanyl-D-alanine ligase [Clostridium perfringens]EHR1330088.1 UDP-N-acetylmuramoyl-tripeptide--D-alanyl-D-alanine ligase [Clostridium perfringens]EHR1425775.1 UDP-N-acetylmuramoyl-tripeptide--D-alanyl-D-alanine ligase [Clostridium perfringens]EIF6163695.1 UDP-N-acetylmuramoyl-tripeptide--D-alanyl-D-alanine ligase [Clostridium perfringens]EJT5926849.1 UDP-N-acet